jgi:hypothetical protein
MAGEQDLKAKIVIEAQDQASAVISRLAGQMGGLGTSLTRMAAIAGPVALALGAVGGALAGITRVGVGVANQVEQLDLLSTRTGVTVEALQVLQRQVQLMGGDAEGLSTAFSFLNRAIATGDPLLKKLGITTHDTLQAFFQLSEAFAASDDTAKKTEIAFQLLGRGSASLLGVLPQLAAGFDKTKASMEAAGGLMTGSVLQGARNLDKAADDLGSSWTDLMTKLRATTVPTALAVVQALNDMWDALSGNKKPGTAGIDDEISRTQRRIAALEATAASIQPLSPIDTSALQRLARVNAMLDEQRAKMRELIKSREDLETATERAARAEAKLGKTGATDALANVQLEEQQKKAQTLGELIADLQKNADNLLETEAKLRGEGVLKLKPGPKAVEPDLILPRTTEDVMEEWNAKIDEMLSSAELLDSTFHAVFFGLQAGFHAMFTSIASGTATLGSVLKDMWHGIVNAIIAELARIAAVAAVKFVFSAIGLPIPKAGLTITPTVGEETLAMALPNQAAANPQTTVNIYSYDLRDGVRELASLSGVHRRANARLAYLGEY